jgi:hypothetical protein
MALWSIGPPDDRRIVLREKRWTRLARHISRPGRSVSVCCELRVDAHLVGCSGRRYRVEQADATAAFRECERSVDGHGRLPDTALSPAPTAITFLTPGNGGRPVWSQRRARLSAAHRPASHRRWRTAVVACSRAVPTGRRVRSIRIVRAAFFATVVLDESSVTCRGGCRVDNGAKRIQTASRSGWGE